MSQANEPRRAHSIEEFQARISQFVSEASLKHAAEFRPRPDDVIIATYPKAGTTWMQQIVHGLRSRGDMSFDEITEVTPWLELALDLGWDLDRDHRFTPRVFKSHWNASQVPSGCKRINVLRDPVDTMISFYNFMNGWFLEKGCVSQDAFIHYIALRDHHAGDYWNHLAGWWERRHDPDVLVVCYEDMKADLASVVRRVARLIGLSEEDPALAIATRQSVFDFMKAHERQFDDHLIAEARNPACGLPADARSSKVQQGRSNHPRSLLAPTTLELLERRWREQALPRTGHASYAELRSALADERREQR